MPPKTAIEQLGQIDNLGEDRIQSLIYLVGADAIEDTEQTDETLMQKLPKAIITWDASSQEQKEQIADLLSQRVSKSGINGDVLLKNISAGCNRIVNLARFLKENPNENITETDVALVLEKARIINGILEIDDQIREAFPGIVEKQETES